MASQNYDAIMRRVLKSEGGYVNHPSDPGGPTNYGITLATYQRFKKPNATAADVRVMPLGDAMEIYRQRYWSACGCGLLPSGVDYSIMDYAVNSGNGRAMTVLRHVVGLTTSATLKQVVDEIAKRDVKAVIAAINDERLAFMRSLKIWSTFGKGWTARVADVLHYSLTIAKTGAEHPTAQAVPDPLPNVGKAEHTVSKKTAAAGALVPGAAAAGGATLAPQGFIASHIGLMIFAAVIVLLIIAAIVGIVVGRAQHRQLVPMPVPSVPPLPPQGDLLAKA